MKICEDYMKRRVENFSFQQILESLKVLLKKSSRKLITVDGRLSSTSTAGEKAKDELMDSSP